LEFIGILEGLKFLDLSAKPFPGLAKEGIKREMIFQQI
jgi:hypothetical protein